VIVDSVRAASVALVVGIMCSLAGPAAADNPFPSLAGSWRGPGTVKLTGGQTESIKCKAYYTNKSGGSVLGLAILCGSASVKIDMRANLEYSGGKVTGTWEERQFNAAGTVSGSASSNKITLAITGGGLTGSLSVSLASGSHSVSISTQGVGFTGVSIQFSRSG